MWLSGTSHPCSRVTYLQTTSTHRTGAEKLRSPREGEVKPAFASGGRAHGSGDDGGMCVTVKSAVRLDVVFGVRHERSYVSIVMATALCRMDRAMRWATAHPG